MADPYDTKICPACGSRIPNYLPLTRKRVVNEYVQWTWPENFTFNDVPPVGRFIGERDGRAMVTNRYGEWLVDFVEK